MDYKGFANIPEDSTNSLWESLTENQQRQVLEAYEESEKEETLIPLSAIKDKYL